MGLFNTILQKLGFMKDKAVEAVAGETAVCFSVVHNSAFSLGKLRNCQDVIIIFYKPWKNLLQCLHGSRVNIMHQNNVSIFDIFLDFLHDSFCVFYIFYFNILLFTVSL